MIDFKEIINQKFGENTAEIAQEGLMIILKVPKNEIDNICQYLHDHELCYMDCLSCLTAIDMGVDIGQIEVVYNLYSIPFNHKIALKVSVSRNLEQAESIPSVSHIWHSANWDEREAFDFFGVKFEGHPDLRRILLPNDWQGYPLRKDYEQQETYHGIKVGY